MHNKAQDVIVHRLDVLFIFVRLYITHVLLVILLCNCLLLWKHFFFYIKYFVLPYSIGVVPTLSYETSVPVFNVAIVAEDIFLHTISTSLMDLYT